MSITDVEIELRIVGDCLVAYAGGEPIEYRRGTTDLDAMLLMRATRKRVRRMLRGHAGEIERAEASRERIARMIDATPNLEEGEP